MSHKTATRIKRLNERQSLYQLSPPLINTRGPIKEAEYVISSCNTADSAEGLGYRETLIFKASAEGKPVHGGALTGSQKHIADCDAVLVQLGYSIVGVSS